MDLGVSAFFSEEMLGDPGIFNNEEMEEHPLGTTSSYRYKVMVSYNDL